MALDRERNQPGLRVGLTGGLGSGKSTVAAMFARRGARVLSADELARSLMQPGQAVFAAIVDTFGPGVAGQDGTLDRPALARLAFAGGRVEELNAIIHPATIALQNRLAAEILSREPSALIVVESALIFESRYSEAGIPGVRAGQLDAVSQNSEPGSWTHRFDRLILVAAPEKVKVARFVARSAAQSQQSREELAAEAGRRLARMIADEKKVPHCDFVIRNDGTLEDLEQQVEQVWRALRDPDWPSQGG